MDLSILYRGPLSSCNYGCDYCPFAKHSETAAEHREDERALNRFVSWVSNRTSDNISILFTPWGEALIRKRYQQALVRLSNMPQVRKVVIQTNLSCSLNWVDDCDKRKLALWTTFHPTEVSRARFVTRCLELHQRGVRFSVGVVGLKEHTGEIEALRRELPASIYLWINAYKHQPDYYSSEDIERFEAIDSLFPINNKNHPSLGRACRCGASVISVYGDGSIRRCHFIHETIGNIYYDDLLEVLRERACSNRTCGCHIGYVHMDHLKLYQIYGDGILERIPETLQPLKSLPRG
ncbi:MAG TPA: STM4011 family radical SAM protein [Pyrinomonadaceae bacterium]|nr:STM4011 family radical SAM protein [Pyrinomonadaceae bacterium]